MMKKLNFNEKNLTETQKIFYKVTENKEKIYLNENNHSVALLKEIISDHAELVDNRNYKNLNFEDEYKLYTKDLKNKLKLNENEVKMFYENNKLETKHSSLVFDEAEFNENLTKVVLKVTDQFRIINTADSSQFAEYRGKIFSQKRKYVLEYELGEWRINEVSSLKE